MTISILPVNTHCITELTFCTTMDYRERLSAPPLLPPPGAFAFDSNISGSNRFDSMGSSGSNSHSQAAGQKLLQAMILQGKDIFIYEKKTAGLHSEICRAGHATTLPRQPDHVFRPKEVAYLHYGCMTYTHVRVVATPFRLRCHL